MKRLAILIGGLLVMPAFAEVAPVFIEDEGALEYADGMYDENGFLVAPGAEIVDAETETATTETQTPVKISRAPVNATPVANRTTSTRAMPASSGATTASGRGSANGNSSRVVAARTTTATPRATASRTVASRGTTATSPRTGTTSTRTATSTAATRAAAARTTGGATRAVAPSAGASVARTATTSPRTTAARTATATTARAATASGRLSVDPNRNFGPGDKGTVTVNSIGSVDTTNKPLYNKSASIRRTPTIRMSSLNGISAETTAVSTMSLEDMDDLAELTDYCKAQYANCMDNYCNVLDDNQGRCSCSANIKNYAKAEQALKTATEELQDVAQKIQYIGLTSREVETLFTETIAEETMRTKGTDNSQLQASLNKIKDMIIDVKSGTATSSSSNDILGLNFDLSGLLEFSFDSTGFDLGSLFGTTNTNSVSNQRGEELYKTAAARCKSSVLKACTARGVDASIITNAYDLEIDRECMAYERSLNDSNDQMLATVRNAKNVLQKARLMVAQQKNAYDMRGCINALDSCMQDEFVCGSDYENCLDPTGRYIVNGAIVVGSQPGHAIDPELSNNVASVMTSDVCRVNLYRTWDMVPGTCEAHRNSSGYTTYLSNPTDDQGNAWGSGPNDTLSKYIEKTVTGNYPAKTSENMSLYLQNKIGYNQKDRNYGMCMSVLNKCQDYTYTRGTGTSAQYEPANQVVQQYLARVLVQIKAKQDEILANYAETCVSDVTSCLGQNGYPTEDPNDWETTEYSTNRTKMNIAVNACRAQIVTCMSVNGYSIDTPTPTEMNCWVQGLLYSTSTDDCMWDNIYENRCKSYGDDYIWCSSTNSCTLPAGCPSAPTSYSVTIDCGDGTLKTSSPKNTTNGRLTLSENWCELSGSTLNSWMCGGSLVASNGSYEPTSEGTTCVARWGDDSSETYHYSLTCGNGCNTDHIEGASEPNVLISYPNCGSSVTWNCEPSLSWGTGSSGFFMPKHDLTCNATCGSTPTTYSVNLTCGVGTTGGSGYHNNNVQSGTSVSLSGLCQCSSGVSNKLSWNGVCTSKTTITVNNDIDCTATCLGQSGDEEHTVTVYCGVEQFVPNGNSEVLCSDGTCGLVTIEANQCVNLGQYCSNASASSSFNCGVADNLQSGLQNLCPQTDGISCVLTEKGSSAGTGGLRYVRIENASGTRVSQERKGGMLTNEMEYVWVDTDGSSTCGERGVYIANTETNSLACNTPVTSIGWWRKPETRSSGFYITLNTGEKVLFAREWGAIVTENLGKLVATDPDTTLVAEPTVYDTNVAYVSFDEGNKTWVKTFAPNVPDYLEYYVHNMFDINFYPNRPGRSGNNTDPTGIYRYIEGDGYYAENGSKRTTAPTITESGYTFRGFYPGKLNAVSNNDTTGMVWPASTGGQSPVSLNNVKWVLATMDPNFSGLNLYAAWAKNCPSQLPEGMQKCQLTIGTDGSVTYTVECMPDYELIGSGADATCIVPGSNWRSVEFAGATVAY